jgi:branched-chain amino acid transport system ATP-binding protein
MRVRALLECVDVAKNFGGLQALKSVTLTADHQKITGIVGPNGSGKSTLMKLISGFYRLDSGNIIFDGHRITNLPSHDICRLGISRTSQIVQAFYGMTALENVLVGSTFGAGKRVPPSDRRRAAEDALGMVNFPPEKIHTRGSDLTIAELKRVQLAKALASKPKLLLLDELLTGLNPTESDKEIQAIRRINTLGTTIIIVEHVMRIIMGLCDRVIVLQHGEKLAEGTPEEISKNDSVVKAYLGRKYALHEDNNTAQGVAD